MSAPDWFSKPIISDPIREADIEALQHVQRVLHCEPTGKMDDATKLHIRGFQRMMGLRVHGAVDESTATKLDEFLVVGAYGEDDASRVS